MMTQLRKQAAGDGTHRALLVPERVASGELFVPSNRSAPTTVRLRDCVTALYRFFLKL